MLELEYGGGKMRMSFMRIDADGVALAEQAAALRGACQKEKEQLALVTLNGAVDALVSAAPRGPPTASALPPILEALAVILHDPEAREQLGQRGCAALTAMIRRHPDDAAVVRAGFHACRASMLVHENHRQQFVRRPSCSSSIVPALKAFADDAPDLPRRVRRAARDDALGRRARAHLQGPRARARRPSSCGLLPLLLNAAQGRRWQVGVGVGGAAGDALAPGRDRPDLLAARRPRRPPPRDHRARQPHDRRGRRQAGVLLPRVHLGQRQLQGVDRRGQRPHLHHPGDAPPPEQRRHANRRRLRPRQHVPAHAAELRGDRRRGRAARDRDRLPAAHRHAAHAVQGAARGAQPRGAQPGAHPAAARGRRRVLPPRGDEHARRRLRAQPRQGGAARPALRRAPQGAVARDARDGEDARQRRRRLREPLGQIPRHPRRAGGDPRGDGGERLRHEQAPRAHLVERRGVRARRRRGSKTTPPPRAWSCVPSPISHGRIRRGWRERLRP